MTCYLQLFICLLGSYTAFLCPFWLTLSSLPCAKAICFETQSLHQNCPSGHRFVCGSHCSSFKGEVSRVDVTCWKHCSERLLPLTLSLWQWGHLGVYLATPKATTAVWWRNFDSICRWNCSNSVRYARKSLDCLADHGVQAYQSHRTATAWYRYFEFFCTFRLSLACPTHPLIRRSHDLCWLHGFPS